MASRIPELSSAPAQVDCDNEPGMMITPGLVDRAVTGVLAGLPEEDANALEGAWVADGAGDLGRLLQGAYSARTSRLKMYATAARVPITIKYMLTDEEQKTLIGAHPDMALQFSLAVVHDHGMAAAGRTIASRRLHSRVPPGRRYVDFGGSILMHVEEGNLSVHVVGGLHDSKDPTRDTLTNMRLKKLAVSPSASNAARQMATSVLNNEGIYYSTGKLEDFSKTNFSVGVMSHVYDVPLPEIPRMMHRCGISLFEGVLHYSTRFHLEDEGELESVGARFKVEDGSFMMGFVDSPSIWYVHDWNEFQHYGVDQTFQIGRERYSYRVYERRGDTISFRLMPAGKGVIDKQTALFKPGVPMVEVKSFSNSNSSTNSRSERACRHYPTDVWERMVRSAILDLLKGNMQMNEHVMSYRNITAGHLYNRMSTVSQKVDLTDVPWLVVDSALYAMVQVMLFRRGIGSFVDEEMARRAVLDKPMIDLGVRALAETLTTALKLPLLPLKWITGKVIVKYEDIVGRVVEAAPVTRYVTIESTAAADRDTGEYVASAGTALESLVRFANEQKALDRLVDLLVDEAKADKACEPTTMFDSVNVEGIEYNRDTESDITRVNGASTVHSEKPAWVPVAEPIPGVADKYTHMESFHSEFDRVASVRESISCAGAEARDMTTWCANMYMKYCAGGNPVDRRELAAASENNRDLDIWQVNEGVIVSSVLGHSDRDFTSGGVYSPVPMMVTHGDGISRGSHLMAVKEASYAAKGMIRTHHVLDVPYTGYVLTCKDLKIFNGAQLIAGLEKSLLRSSRVEIAGLLGVPGCGKSHTIENLFKRGDMVITPLRESAKDLRDKLVKAGKLTQQSSLRAVRTIDSILCEAGRYDGDAHSIAGAHRVFVDECFNVLPGRYYAALNIVGADRALVYGDNRQIPPVVRAEVTLAYQYMRYEHSVERWLNFRSLPEVVACFAGYYDYRIRAVREGTGSVKEHHGVNVTLPDSSDVLLLSMRQVDKAVLARMYPARANCVHTVHEAQGRQARHVYLFNFESRKISDENTNYLYNKESYVNVAISRAQDTFTYAYTSVYPDVVKRWIARGASPSLISAISDAQSAGTEARFA